MKGRIRTQIKTVCFALTLATLFSLLLAPATTLAQRATAIKPPRVKADFKERKLKNSRRVSTVEDGRAPVISGADLTAPAQKAERRATVEDVLASTQAAKVTPLLAKDLAGLAGKEAVMLTVEYAPGASSSKHRHNAHTFVYVLEGSIVMQIAGGKAVTLGQGQTFYESPDDVHVVSKNASDSQPAKFLVFFVKEKGASSLVPVP